MNIWHDIAKERIQKDDFIGVIEISKGGKNKYELDKETGMLKLDRVLYTSTHYPANYGFIPRTYARDNDPLDVLVLCQENIIPLTLVECYPIGVLIMIDGEEYVVLLPVEDDEEEDGEVVILKVEDTDSEDEESYVSVDDQEILNKVFEIFKEKFKYIKML